MALKKQIVKLNLNLFNDAIINRKSSLWVLFAMIGIIFIFVVLIVAIL